MSGVVEPEAGARLGPARQADQHRLSARAIALLRAVALGGDQHLTLPVRRRPASLSSRAGYRCFDAAETFRTYVEREILLSDMPT